MLRFVVLLALFAADARANPYVLLFQKLGPMPGPEWNATALVPLERAHHPQGAKLLGDRLFLTTVEGQSAGHLNIYELDSAEQPGSARLQPSLTFAGQELVHAVGLDGNAEHLYFPLAGNRSSGPAQLIELDPLTLQYHSIAWLNDHVGTVIYDPGGRQFGLVDWSTGLYTIPFSDLDFIHEVQRPWEKQELARSWEYQDCKSVGDGFALCSAKSRGLFPLGEIHLVRFQTGSWAVVHAVAVPRLKPNGEPGGVRPLSFNAMDVGLVYSEGAAVGLRFYFVPYDNADAHLMVFEARP